MYWESGFALLLMGTAFLRGRIPYRLRALTVIVTFFFLGMGVLLAYGLIGMGVYFFVFGSLIANLCFGVRWGFVATLASLVCMVMIGLVVHYGWFRPGPDFNDYAWAPYSWAAMILVTGAFLSILHLGLHRLFTCLTGTIVALDHRSNQLAEANRRLVREIDDRCRIEKDLRNSEMKYRMVVDNANEGILVLRGGRIHFANNRFLNVLDYSFEELSSRKAEDFMHPDDLQSAARTIEMILRREIDCSDMEIRLRGKNGEFRWFYTHLARTKWEESPAIISFIYEITDRKAVEAEKARLQARLKQAEKMEILGTLAGSVAHDLNNVLVGVTSYPDYLLTQIPEGSNLRGPLETIKRSGEKAVAIVQDMLTLARRRVKASSVFNLNHIVGDFLSSPEFEKMRSYHPGVRVESELDDQLDNIKGSPIHLSKTVMNLVSNALESVGDNGRVCIATENRTGVNRKAGPCVALKITDNGSGIAPDDIEQIYEPFYTKKTMGRSGTGLGMTVVWNAVKDHGGDIEVDSIEGRGTTFTLFFPATTARPEISRSDCSVETKKGCGANVLVVDDSRDYRQMLVQYLTDMGYKCAAAADGLEAVQHLKANRVDLALLDMVMDPGPDGLDTYKEMLSHNPDLRAIVVSGFPETERVREAQGLGAGPFMQKPFNFEKLGIVVQAELARSATSKSH